MTAIVLDTETTGLTHPEVIEASWMQATFVVPADEQQYATLLFTEPVTTRFKPVSKISMGAMATHHIMDEDLIECPPSSSFKLPGDVIYIIGHNIDFDWTVAGCPADIRRIDTLRLARKYWPECDSHSLGALTYYLFRAVARAELRSSHSAETDVLLTGRVLNKLVRKAHLNNWSFQALWELSEAARIPEFMPFGKHKGKSIASVPNDYKVWLLKQDDVDPYLAMALRQ